MYLFSLKNTQKLAKQICAKTGFKSGSYDARRFSDNEIYLQIQTRVSGQNVFIIGSTSQPNDNILELLILANALKENGAKKITAIIPYLGYSRQDKKDRPGAPVTSKLMAKLLKIAEVNNFITIDLHSQRNKEDLGPNLINLLPLEIFANYIKKNINLRDTIIVAPDNGAKKRAIDLARLLDHLPVLLMQKIRLKQNMAKAIKFKRNIIGKNIIITDDMIDTAGTICAACHELKIHKVKNIYIFATHGILSGPAIARIKQAPIKQVIITDTYPLPKEKRSKKIKVLTILPLLLKLLK